MDRSIWSRYDSHISTIHLVLKWTIVGLVHSHPKRSAAVPSNKAGELVWRWSIISLKHWYVFVWATTHYFI